jgi:hypothetical protein
MGMITATVKDGGIDTVAVWKVSRYQWRSEAENIPVIFCCASTIAGDTASNIAVGFMIMILMVLVV